MSGKKHDGVVQNNLVMYSSFEKQSCEWESKHDVYLYKSKLTSE